MAEDDAADVPTEQRQPQDTRAGFVALIGVPNAGKSTLLNALVGAKVSIVSRKVQTTRALVRGIVMEGAAQIILVDTPGIFAPKRRLDRAMVHSAWSGAADADAVPADRCPQGVDEEVETIIRRLPEVKRPKILILNKIDLIPRERLLELAAKLNQQVPFEDTFMISALKGDGIERLREALAQRMPPSPWLYPEDQVSDAPLRMLAAEITRRRSTTGSTRSCPTAPPSRPTSGRSGPTARCASSRLSSSSARASARSCSARTARPSRRSGRPRASRFARWPRPRST